MAYKIKYGIEPDGKKGPRRALLTILVFVLFLTGVLWKWPEGRTVIWEFLIPGGAERMEPAVQAFARNIDSGGTFLSAMEQFFAWIMGNVS